MPQPGLLVVVLIGLYLIDCLTLLGPGEALFVFEKSAVRLDFGLGGYVVRGRVPAMLNPLTPSLLVFRSAPLMASGVVSIALHMHPLRRCHYWVLTTWPVLLIHAGLLFGAVPYFLATGRYVALATSVGFAFVFVALLLCVGWRLRADLGLSRWQYGALAFQSVVCLPMSMNLLRKLALSTPPRYTALDLFSRLRADQREHAAGELRFALEAQTLASTDSAEIARLEALQKAIDGKLV